MADEKKRNTVASLTAAFGRVKAQADSYKETGTMLAREIVNTGESFSASVAAGFCDEVWGELDAKTGLRTHKTSGIPTAFIVAAAGKLAGAMGAVGEFRRDAFAVSTGIACHYGSTQGRALGAAFRTKREAEAPKKEETAKAA